MHATQPRPKSLTSFKRVLVLVDAFSDDPKLAPETTTRAARFVVGKGDSEIILLNVLTPKAVGLRAEEFPQRIEHFTSVAKAVLKETSAIFADDTRTKCLVRPIGEDSLPACVDATLDYADQAKVDLIAVSTRARRGMDLWLLGSFTKQLMEASRYPLLVVNPTCPRQKPYDSLFFPVGKRAPGAMELDQVAGLARALAVPVTLFHYTRPAAIPPLPGLAGLADFEGDIRSEEAVLVKAAASLREAGVDVTVESRCGTDSVANAILDASKNRSSALVVMQANRAPNIGKTIRTVVREATCPVLVVGHREMGNE